MERSDNAAVAQKLGYTRAAVSCVRRGVYAGNPDKLLTKALEVYDLIDCPHTRRGITPDDCRAAWDMPRAPSHNPLKMELWRACQSCAHKGGRHG